MTDCVGLVIRGSKNIFVVRNEDGSEYECRLKGKVLKGVDGYYNPLAPGDRVYFEIDALHEDKAQILALVERRNSFARFNQKGQAPQLLAANVDLICCITTPDSPPFRPRFLDRVLLQADIAEIPAVIVLNKDDLSGEHPDPDVEERLEDFRRIGYRILRVSALTGQGLEEFSGLLKGRFSVFTGQSGVGKSSLLNALDGTLRLRVGNLCEKYDRGSHTTSMAQLLDLRLLGASAQVVDTPGIRRLVPYGVNAKDLALHLRDFAPLVGRCSYGLSCSHEREPGCKIMEAVDAGVIHEDRYETFLRLREELARIQE